MSSKVFKAVIPAAGRGIRMRPLTDAVPKELLLLGRVPMIHRAVEEAIGAGIRDVCVVIRKEKEIIRDYLTKSAGGFDGKNLSSNQAALRLSFLYQRAGDGLGGALRVTREFVGNQYFLMIIPDQMFIGKRMSASQQLVSQFQFRTPTVLSSLVRIPNKEVSYFSSSRGFSVERKALFSGDPFPIDGVLPDSAVARVFKKFPFEVRGFGRTIFPPAIFQYLGPRFSDPKTGEIDLLRTFQAFSGNLQHYGCLLRGRPCDLGTLPGYYRYLRFFTREL